MTTIIITVLLILLCFSIMTCRYYRGKYKHEQYWASKYFEWYRNQWEVTIEQRKLIKAQREELEQLKETE